MLLCAGVVACSSQLDAREDDPAGDAVDEPSDAEDALDASTSLVPPKRPTGQGRDAEVAAADAQVVAPSSLAADASREDASFATADGSSVNADAGVVAAACNVGAGKARCTSESILMVGAPSDPRKVYWARPSTPAPSSGYRAVLLYQGSLFGPSTTWNVDVPKGQAFGGYYQVQVVAELLARGFVVVQPEAQGERFWTTNVTVDFDGSADGVFIPLLLAEVEKGTFGPVDVGHLYATGMSSGGYMTSRMAVSFPKRFRALAIHSASYATCGGPSCFIPAKLPVDHPPTLFLHGGADTIVPISTADAYASKLEAQGFETAFERVPAAGHEWLPVAPEAITRWFMAH